MDDLNKKGEFKLNNHELKKIQETFLSESLSEEETRLTIKEFYEKEKILIDPHTAIGIGVLKKISLNEKNIVLATAHPFKFSDVVIKETNFKPELPENLKNILDTQEKYENLSNDQNTIQNYILKRI